MGLNKSTLSEQIYQILRNDILTQKIKCGEKLTLKILQERFQVSSTPIREALTRLTQDQLVSYYSNINVWNHYSDEFHLIFYRYCNNSRLTESADRLRSGISIFSNQYSRETGIQSQIDDRRQRHPLYLRGSPGNLFFHGRPGRSRYPLRFSLPGSGKTDGRNKTDSGRQPQSRCRRRHQRLESLFR